MNTSGVEPIPRAQDVRLTPDELVVDLQDGRTVSVPLAWFPKLLHATERQRRKWKLVGDGEGIHWPAIDEDLSVAGLLRGTAAPQPLARRTRSNDALQRPGARKGPRRARR